MNIFYSVNYTRWLETIKFFQLACSSPNNESCQQCGQTQFRMLAFMLSVRSFLISRWFLSYCRACMNLREADTSCMKIYTCILETKLLKKIILTNWTNFNRMKNKTKSKTTMWLFWQRLIFNKLDVQFHNAWYYQ